MKFIIMIIMICLFLGCSQEADNSSSEPTNRTDTTDTDEQEVKMPKVTGIGGIFFKSDDPKMMKEWYQNNLGMKTDDYGTLFEFRLAEAPEKKGYLQWSPFSAKTKYFEPSKKEFMINYRVVNLEKLLENLAADGVKLLDEIEYTDYGNFAHIMDPEGNKIELWEPVENDFTKDYESDSSK